MECNPLLDEFPTLSEIVKAIKLLSSGKAPGSDAIAVEIYKAEGPHVTEKLTELFHIMWRKEAIPEECKATGKICAKVLLNTLSSQGFYQKASVDSGRTKEQ